MYDLKIRYLASAFVDAESLHPTAERIAELTKVLGEGALPVTVAEFSEGKLIQRMGFRTEADGLEIFLRSTRFDVIWRPAVRSDGTGNNIEPEVFFPRGGRILGAVLDSVGRRGHRLAAVQEGFPPQVSTQEMDDIAERLLGGVQDVLQANPFEWDWRAAAAVQRTFGSVSELINTIARVNRVSGSIAMPGQSEERYDRIRVDVDLNTVPSNTTARFGSREIADYFACSAEWHGGLFGRLASLLAGPA